MVKKLTKNKNKNIKRSIKGGSQNRRIRTDVEFKNYLLRLEPYYTPSRTREVPYIPPEILRKILLLKTELFNYERRLTLPEMYQRRLNQGYNSIPRNWIEFNKLKKWNEMTILKRLLWKIGLVDEPSIQYWDTNRTNIRRLSHYNKRL